MAIVKAMSCSEDAWKAVTKFSEMVMLTKEMAERERQAAEMARNSRLRTAEAQQWMERGRRIPLLRIRLRSGWVLSTPV